MGRFLAAVANDGVLGGLEIFGDIVGGEAREGLEEIGMDGVEESGNGQ